MDKLKKKLKTGDLVYFAGTNILSYTIIFLSKTPWTHVGVIMRNGDDLYISESQIDKTDGDVKQDGVGLNPFEERLKKCKTPIMFVRLKQKITREQNEAAWRRYSELKGRNFSKSLFLDVIFKSEDQLSRLFCSQYIAEIYKAMGLIDKSLLSNKFSPNTFLVFDKKFSGIKYEYEKPYEYFNNPQEDIINTSTYVYIKQNSKILKLVLDSAKKKN
jgi:hypothetical protein